MGRSRSSKLKQFAFWQRTELGSQIRIYQERRGEAKANTLLY
jgi:hypothetical protein